MPKGGKKQNSTVKPMPSLIFNNLQASREPEVKNQRKIKINPTNSEILLKKVRQQYKTKNWFILIVVSLATIICILWGYALWQRIASFNFNKTDENKILKNTQASWDKAFSSTENTELEKELTKLQLKNILSQAIDKEKNNYLGSNSIIISTSTSSTTN